MKPVVVWRVRPKKYAALLTFARNIYNSLNGNIFYPSPLVSLPDLLAQINLTQASLSKWGIKGNRGSTADLFELKKESLNLYNLIVSEGQFVQAAAQLQCGGDYTSMAAIIASSGYEIRNQGSPQGLLQPVRYFRRVLDPAYNLNTLKARWRKPLAVTSGSNVHAYRVYMSTTPDFADATQLAVVTRTEFIFVNPNPVASTFYFWVTGISAAGDGARSEILMVQLTSF